MRTLGFIRLNMLRFVAFVLEHTKICYVPPELRARLTMAFFGGGYGRSYRPRASPINPVYSESQTVSVDLTFESWREDDCWQAVCVELGVFGQGNDPRTATANAHEATDEWIAWLVEKDSLRAALLSQKDLIERRT